MFTAKKLDTRKSLSKKFDIYSKIVFRDVGKIFPTPAELVLRHMMRVSNYFVNSFYSVGGVFYMYIERGRYMWKNLLLLLYLCI